MTARAKTTGAGPARAATPSRKTADTVSGAGGARDARPAPAAEPPDAAGPSTTPSTPATPPLDDPATTPVDELVAAGGEPGGAGGLSAGAGVPPGPLGGPQERGVPVTTIVLGRGGPAGAGAADPDRSMAAVPAATRTVLRRTGFTLTQDGSYGACLAEAEGGWFAERWTLGGPETYSVPLPGAQPEEPGTPVAPLPDGRVLVLRRVADRYDAVLLSPTGPGTGEVALAPVTGEEVRLLPPSPVPGTAYVLACTEDVSTVFQVLGAGDAAPMAVTTIRGRCTGGVWLDREGRLLALDRELDGRAKAVAVDLRTGTTSTLLQLTEDSDDRLVLAEPDSGLLVVRSDAAGGSRLGWGVLGSNRPVRFPDALCVPGLQLGPVAAQPGQILSPESVVVALRAEAPGGAESVALWRPGERHVHWRAAPAGWLSGSALWLPGTDLRLPCAAPDPALMRYDTPPAEPVDPVPPAPPTDRDPAGPGLPAQGTSPFRPGAALGTAGPAAQAVVPGDTVTPGARVVRETGRAKVVRRWAAVVPLQQAPLSAGVAGSPA